MPTSTAAGHRQRELLPVCLQRGETPRECGPSRSRSTEHQGQHSSHGWLLPCSAQLNQSRPSPHTAAPTAWQPTVAALLACLGSRLAAAQCHPGDSGPPAASCSVWCSSGNGRVRHGAAPALVSVPGLAKYTRPKRRSAPQSCLGVAALQDPCRARMCRALWRSPRRSRRAWPEGLRLQSVESRLRSGVRDTAEPRRRA